MRQSKEKEVKLTSELVSFFFFFWRGGPRSSSLPLPACSRSGPGTSPPAPPPPPVPPVPPPPWRLLCPLLGLSTIDLALFPLLPLSCDASEWIPMNTMNKQTNEQASERFKCRKTDFLMHDRRRRRRTVAGRAGRFPVATPLVAFRFRAVVAAVLFGSIPRVLHPHR